MISANFPVRSGLSLKVRSISIETSLTAYGGGGGTTKIINIDYK
jgi:hypothetical protein